MNPPQYQAGPGVDQGLSDEQKQAEQDRILALQSRLRGDTASIMTRYGTSVAMSGAKIGSPLSSGAGY